MELGLSIFLNELTKKVRSDSDRSFYICPITKQIMLDPVLASDNYTYEHYAIKRVLNTTGKSPKTGQSLTNVLQSNISMKEQIDAYKLGSVYFIQPPEYIGTNTYKIGRSRYKDFERINQYTKNKKKADPIAHNQCNYYWFMEKALKEEFKKKFTLVKGSEYFAGDKAKMMMVYSSVVAKYSKKHYDLDQKMHVYVAWKLGQSQPVQFNISQNFVDRPSRTDSDDSIDSGCSTSPSTEMEDDPPEDPGSDDSIDSDCSTSPSTETSQKRQSTRKRSNVVRFDPSLPGIDDASSEEEVIRPTKRSKKRGKYKTVTPPPLNPAQQSVLDEWFQIRCTEVRSSTSAPDTFSICNQMRVKAPHSYNNYCKERKVEPITMKQFNVAIKEKMRYANPKEQPRRRHQSKKCFDAILFDCCSGASTCGNKYCLQK